MPYPIALLDAHDLPDGQFDATLIKSMKKNVIKDVHLLIDPYEAIRESASSQKLDKDNYTFAYVSRIHKLMAQLRAAGITVHQVITPMDRFWNRLPKDEDTLNTLYETTLSYEENPADNESDHPLSKFAGESPWGDPYFAWRDSYEEIEAVVKATRVYVEGDAADQIAKKLYIINSYIKCCGYKTKVINEPSRVINELIFHYLEVHPAETRNIIVANTQRVASFAEKIRFNESTVVYRESPHPKEYDNNFLIYYKLIYAEKIATIDAKCRRLTKSPSYTQQKRELVNKYQEAKKTIEEAKKSAASDPVVMRQLTEALFLIDELFDAGQDPAKAREKAKELTLLAQTFSKNSTTTWKALKAALLGFACAALIVAGILTAIPTGGSSLLLAAIIGAAGLSAGAGFAVLHSKGKSLLTSSLGLFGKVAGKFHAEESPFVIEFKEATGCFLKDWNTIDASQVTIDGTNVEELLPALFGECSDSASQDRSSICTKVLFETENDLNRFIDTYLLKNIAEEDQQAAREKLQFILHRQGFLGMASNAADRFMKDNNLRYKKDERRSALNFTTTPTGFIVQEILTQYEGDSFVYQAEATMQINITDNGKSYTTELISNTLIRGEDFGAVKVGGCDL